VIDIAGADAQAKQPSLPEQVVMFQKRILFITQRMEAAIANHEFEKARFYSDEERKTRGELKHLEEKYKLDKLRPVVNIRPEDIENAAQKFLRDPGQPG
jgi:ATP-dependent Clp protease ATP-binding subunit ClpC